jgi:transposase
MRPHGTAEELERRRIRAVELMNSGQSHTKIAAILGVNRGSLYRWRIMARKGPEGLRAVPSPGAPRQLDETRLPELEFLLGQGAKAHGWPNELWTSKRVANLIRKFFGVQYHEGHVRKILTQLLHWSGQKPEYRARERDEAAIERWRSEEFPRIKKSPGPRRHTGVPR